MSERAKKAWSECENWTTKCNECGRIMHFNKNKFAYYCNNCGNILEV